MEKNQQFFFSFFKTIDKKVNKKKKDYQEENKQKKDKNKKVTICGFVLYSQYSIRKMYYVITRLHWLLCGHWLNFFH